MKENEKKEISGTIKSFEDLKHVNENGVEYWSLRELASQLGYSRYRNIQPAVERARQSMEADNKDPNKHMAQSRQELKIKNQYGTEVTRELDDLHLTQYGAYLVTMNGDPNKSEIAAAQRYFATAAKVKDKAEKIIQEIEDDKYISERRINKAANKKFAGICLNNGVKEEELSTVISEGDRGFYDGKTTKQMKEELNVPENRPLSDFLGPEVLAYKSAATYMSAGIIEDTNACGVNQVSDINYNSNKAMRDLVISNRQKTPEELIINKDVKLVEKKRAKELKKQEAYIDSIADKLQL